MIEKPKKRLGELLIEDGVLSKEALDEALTYQKTQGGLIGQILISCGYISEENLVCALGRQLRIPYLTLVHYSVNPETVTLFTEDFCKKNIVLPFDIDEKNIYIVVADPLNEMMTKEVETKSNKKVQIFISAPSEILNALAFAFAGQNAGKEPKKAA